MKLDMNNLVDNTEFDSYDFYFSDPDQARSLFCIAKKLQKYGYVNQFITPDEMERAICTIEEFEDSMEFDPVYLLIKDHNGRAHYVNAHALR